MILNRNQNVKDWTRYWPRLQSEKNNSFWCLLFIDVLFQDHDVWLGYCVFFPLWYKDYLLAKYSLYIVYYLHPSFHLPDWPRTKYTCMFTFPPQRKKWLYPFDSKNCWPENNYVIKSSKISLPSRFQKSFKKIKKKEENKKKL